VKPSEWREILDRAERRADTASLEASAASRASSEAEDAVTKISGEIRADFDLTENERVALLGDRSDERKVEEILDRAKIPMRNRNEWHRAFKEWDVGPYLSSAASVPPPSLSLTAAIATTATHVPAGAMMFLGPDGIHRFAPCTCDTVGHSATCRSLASPPRPV